MSKDEAPVKVGTETFAEKLDMPEVTLTEAMDQIRLTIMKNQTRGVICLVSEAGQGKSQGIDEIALECGYRVVDVRTAQFGLLSAGIPQRVEEGAETFKIAVPDLFPTDPDEKVIFKFDEVNQGQEHAIAMLFQLLEDRRYLSYRLPRRAIIVMLMNPSTSNYKVSKIETNAAFRRRVKFFYVKPTSAEFLAHARTPEFHYSDLIEVDGKWVPMRKPAHPWVVKFLNNTASMLYDAKARDVGKLFPCPATWQTVSLDLYNLESDGVSLVGDRARQRLGASIGMYAAKEIVDFIKNNEVRVSPEEVLNHYKAKSKIRDRVKELVNEPGGGIPDLCGRLAPFIFNNKLDVATIAPRLALFWSDLPNELAQTLYSLLGAACNEGGSDVATKNIEYMKLLTAQLQLIDVFVALNDRLTKNHNDYDKAMKGGKDPADPMAAP